MQTADQKYTTRELLGYLAYLVVVGVALFWLYNHFKAEDARNAEIEKSCPYFYTARDLCDDPQE